MEPLELATHSLASQTNRRSSPIASVTCSAKPVDAESGPPDVTTTPFVLMRPRGFFPGGGERSSAFSTASPASVGSHSSPSPSSSRSLAGGPPTQSPAPSQVSGAVQGSPSLHAAPDARKVQSTAQQPRESSQSSPAVTMPLPHAVDVQFESQPSPSFV